MFRKNVFIAFVFCAQFCFSADIEVGFSPNAGAEEIVLKTIQSAHKTIRLAAYSFTSKPVIQALIAAKRRNVDVQCTLDKSNAHNKSGEAAANLLVNAGIAVRIDSQHPIHHDKYIVVDNQSVETGSFNYSKAAAESNAENAMVIWNDQRLASQYAQNWQLHANHSEVWRSTF
jgi:phosphatidylserine/phosphatidylglycerophosphate/cardiolipin synthase-like enzyme